MSRADERGDPPIPVFGDRELLELLQLQARKAMAERREREREQDQEQDGAGPEPGEASPGDRPAFGAIPERWRLVPEDFEPWDWQRRALVAWKEHGYRGTVKVATGGGKTLFALAAAQELQNTRESDLRLVIVVPTIPLANQWRDELRASNLPSSAIAMMGGGQEVGSPAGVRVLIAVLASARKLLPKFVADAGWGPKMLLVVDECHRANAERSSRIFDSRPAWTLGLSATPEQEGDDTTVPTDEAYAQSAVGQGLGPIIFEFSLKDSLEAGLLAEFEVHHVGISLDEEEAARYQKLSREISDLRKDLQRAHRKSRSRQGFLAWCQTIAKRGGQAASVAERFIGLANQRKRLLYAAKARREIVLGSISQWIEQGAGRVIVFHESIDEIETLFLEAVAQKLPVVLEHSKLPTGLRNDSIEAFRRGVARAIISARSLIEGFNVPSADLGIIAASSGSVRQRIQSLGRLLRRKPGGETARVLVLYVRDTEDESIYSKQDWERITGAKVNRYFEWNPPPEGKPWSAGFVETGKPPRRYRPPAVEVDVSKLKPGDEWPGALEGVDLRVDQQRNLRTEDGRIVRCPPELVEKVLELNPLSRARLTPPGYLIVRVDDGRGKEQDWRYVGDLGPEVLPSADENGPATEPVRLFLKPVRGRRVIARKGPDRRRPWLHAREGDRAKDPEAGRAAVLLRDWIERLEHEREMEVREFLWDGGNSYWVEIEGERVDYPEPLAPLEFAS